MPWYLLSVLIYFWVPIVGLGLWLLPRQETATLKSLGVSVALFWPLTAAMEYLCLRLDIWTFSEKLDPLVGLRFFGAPVEEFLFWFGAQPFVLLLYLAFDKRFPMPGRGLGTHS